MPQPLWSMFASHIFNIVSLCTVAIFAKPLQMMTKNTSSLSMSPDLIDATFMPNTSASTPALNTSVENFLSIECNGDLYGFNPNIADCEGAALFIPPDSDQMTWAERHTGARYPFARLPFAVFGDRAECFFRAIISGDRPTARASLNQFKSAASALSLQCAASGQSQGGIARNIGGDNNLNVILSTYEPHHNIRCGRSENFGNAPSCENVLADMPATEEMTLFGPGTAPGIEEPLPQLIASADEKCFLRLFSTGRADWASWYSIWQATEATFARCGRKRRFGNFRGLGRFRARRGDVFFLGPNWSGLTVRGRGSWGYFLHAGWGVVCRIAGQYLFSGGYSVDSSTNGPRIVSDGVLRGGGWPIVIRRWASWIEAKKIGVEENDAQFTFREGVC